MHEELRKAVEAIKGVQIPELPAEILQLEAEIKSKFPNVIKITQIIEQNATLSGEVMRVVNSPVMKLPAPVKSIRDAVTIVGLDNIYNLVVSAALKNLFGNKGLIKDIMDHSVDMAFCMADIAEWVEGVSRDEAYMLGLFHNAGALMLAAKNEAQYDPIFRQSMVLPLKIIDDEKSVYDTSHVVIGVLVGKKWRLPVEFLNAIMLHHNVKCANIADDHVRAMVAMIKVASGIVSEITLGAYRGTEMTEYERDGLEELMMDSHAMKEIRTALMTYSFKD